MRHPGNYKNFGTSRLAHATYSQAHHIAGMFGGENRLANLLGVNRSTVYRWTYSSDGDGRDGIIPPHWRAKIEALARVQGVLLRESDWSLRLTNPPSKRKKKMEGVVECQPTS